MSDGEHHLWQFFIDESSEHVLEYVDAKTAVECALRLSRSVGARLGSTRRIIITDAGDLTNFEWIFGSGVTFPKPEHPK